MSKSTKLAAFVCTLSTICLGGWGILAYSVHRDGQEHSFSFEQRYCLSLKEDVANVAELHQDKTMLSLLEKGEWCSGQSYDDMKVVERDIELFKVYLNNKK